MLPSFWAEELAERVLAGGTVRRNEALRILRTPVGDLPLLLRAAFRLRERSYGRRVKLCMLRNARSGHCAEDCRYCSQSAVSKAAIERYPLQPPADLLEGARRAVAAGARRYCMVTSGRGPGARDLDCLVESVREIRREHPNLEICVSPGLLDEAQAKRLKTAGVGWINHNLNTSERFHPQICTTHTYADRVRTIHNARRSGLSICSGGIIGMGEDDEDVVDLAFALGALHVNSLPVNFLHPIDGTPLAGQHDLTPGYCLNALCLFRFTNPDADVRVAGGRELHLGWFQPLAFFPATSIFVEGYLTTPGQAAQAARQMVEEMGFEVASCVE